MCVQAYGFEEEKSCNVPHKYCYNDIKISKFELRLHELQCNNWEVTEQIEENNQGMVEIQMFDIEAA